MMNDIYNYAAKLTLFYNLSALFTHLLHYYACLFVANISFRKVYITKKGVYDLANGKDFLTLQQINANHKS